MTQARAARAEAVSIPDRDRGAEPLLAVDLDGTLVRSDLLHETLMSALRHDATIALRLPWWLARGKAHLKARLAEHGPVSAELLPYDDQVLALVRDEAARGRRVVLATASDRAVAQRVADAVGCFDAVLASDGHTNLAGARKRDALEALAGPAGYDYIGDSRADLPVWQGAREAILVDAPAAVARAARAQGNVRREIARPGSPARGLLRAIRPHQWLKNLLVFAPIAGSHRLLDAQALSATVLAFLAFCACASAVYLINDLLDIESDRRHPDKRKRPLARGALSVPLAVGAAAALLALAAGLALASSPRVAQVLLLYFVTTTSYSFVLKRRSTVDVFVLAGLYTLRVVAGAFAADAPLSFWFLGFSMLLFLSLAMIKRVSELVAMDPGSEKTPGRGYGPDDVDVLTSIGTASGTAAVLVMALYVNSPEVARLHSEPGLLWPICALLLFWINRMWLGARRGRIDSDPLVFALRDRVSQLTLAACAALLTLAV